jgi:DNA-binding transcriptional LysR family regulator
MKLEWLEAFVVFAERLSFTAAARELHVSQPALHVQIARLTEALGAPLYRREGRGLVLTAQGQEALRLAREIRERSRELRDVVRTGASAQPVVLAAGEGAYLYLLGDGVAQFSARGGAPLRLLTRDSDGTLAALDRGEAHLGVAALASVPDGLDAERLTDVPLVVAMPAGHRLAKKRRVALRDLDGARLVVPPHGRPLRTQVAGALLGAGVGWEVAVEATGWPLMLHFVRLGVGLAVVNACCAVPRGVVTRPLPALPPVRYWLLRRRRTPASDELARTLAARVWRP